MLITSSFALYLDLDNMKRKIAAEESHFESTVRENKPRKVQFRFNWHLTLLDASIMNRLPSDPLG